MRALPARPLGCVLALMIAFAAIASVARPAVAEQTRSLDVHVSRAGFSVAHLLVARASGSLPILAASVSFTDAGELKAIEATLDPKKLATGEADRDRELQSADWFDTATYPTWNFASTSVDPAGEGLWSVRGLLTIHGTGSPVVLAVKRIDPSHFTATTSVDRHAFGMHVTRADKLVGSTVTITIDAHLESH